MQEHTDCWAIRADHIHTACVGAEPWVSGQAPAAGGVPPPVLRIWGDPSLGGQLIEPQGAARVSGPVPRTSASVTSALSLARAASQRIPVRSYLVIEAYFDVACIRQRPREVKSSWQICLSRVGYDLKGVASDLMQQATI